MGPEPEQEHEREHQQDLKLRARVLERLQTDPRVAIDRIGIACLDRIITLTGRMSSLAERAQTARIVAAIEGVAAVDDRLVVSLPPHKRLDDPDIAARALALLAANKDLPAGRLGVRVDHGWLRLTGTLDSAAEKHAAERCLATLDIIRGLSNEITVATRNWVVPA